MWGGGVRSKGRGSGRVIRMLRNLSNFCCGNIRKPIILHKKIPLKHSQSYYKFLYHKSGHFAFENLRTKNLRKYFQIESRRSCQ